MNAIPRSTTGCRRSAGLRPAPRWAAISPMCWCSTRCRSARTPPDCASASSPAIPTCWQSSASLRSYGGAQVPLPLQEAATALWQEETHVEENRAALSPQIRRLRGHSQRPLRLLSAARRVLSLARCRRRRSRGAETVARGGCALAARALYRARQRRRGSIPAKRYIRLAIVHDDDTVAAGMRRLLQVL